MTWHSQINSVFLNPTGTKLESKICGLIILHSSNESNLRFMERWLLKKKDSSWFVVEEADLRNLVVWLLEIWEDNQEKLCRLLGMMVDPFDTEKLMVENDDLWEDNGGFNKLINKEKQQRLVRDMAKYAICPSQREPYSWVDLFIDNGQLNKEMHYSHMNGIKKNLDRFLHDVATDFHSGYEQKMLWKEVEEAKNEPREMVDLLKSEGLHYFISGVAEMAHFAQHLIRVMDSHASILYLHISFAY